MGKVEQVGSTPETDDELLNRLTNRLLGGGFQKPLYIQCIADEHILAGDVVMWNNEDGAMGHVKRYEEGVNRLGWGIATQTVCAGDSFQVASKRLTVRSGMVIGEY